VLTSVNRPDGSHYAPNNGVLQRFHAYVQNTGQHGNNRLSSILQPLVLYVAGAIPAIGIHTPPTPSPEEVEQLFETHGDLVSPKIYNALLVYINSSMMEPVHHCANLPHTNPRILPQIAIKHKWFTHITQLFGPCSLLKSWQ
jgi:hypothetical protein